MSEVAVVYHRDFLKHDPGPGHPESPERLTAIMERLAAEKLPERTVGITPEAAEEETVALVHEEEYIRWVAEKCRDGTTYLDRGDTRVCTDSFAVALLAAGAVTAAADWVMKKEGRRAFCAVRPPGHHAQTDSAMGFCLFNNVAVCARYLQRRYGVGKVLIVDWDVHHGNGTQNAFYDDSSVFYFSVHEYPYYPGTGGEDEKGAGKGTGYTMNVPLRAGSGDEDYVRAFREKLVPAAERFGPGIVLVSAGFDAHFADPMAAMCVTEEGFGRLSRIVADIADRHANGRVISVLEGGYDLTAMPASVMRHLRALMA